MPIFARAFMHKMKEYITKNTIFKLWLCFVSNEESHGSKLQKHITKARNYISSPISFNWNLCRRQLLYKENKEIAFIINLHDLLSLYLFCARTMVGCDVLQIDEELMSDCPHSVLPCWQEMRWPKSYEHHTSHATKSDHYITWLHMETKRWNIESRA